MQETGATDATAATDAVRATPAPAAAPRAPRSVPRTERPIQTVGRRKEAIVRVRIVPGTGKFTLNGRTLEAYFPSKVHQQLVREPLVVAERVRHPRHHREPARRWRHRPGRRAAPGDRPRRCASWTARTARR